MIGNQLTEYWDFSHMQSTILKKNKPKPDNPAARIFNQTRILCLVLEDPLDYGKMKAKVKFSWGRRCNKIVFKKDSKMDNNTFATVKEGFQYIYKKYINGYDWFLRVDTKTFVIMENLRRFLYRYDPESSIYFGHRLKSNSSQGYMSGEAGYVLSRGALRRLNLFAFNDSNLCGQELNSSYKSEDRQIGQCLDNVKVIAGKSRDGQGQERFLPLMPHWIGRGLTKWKQYSKSLYFKPTSQACCSSSLISFHPASDYAFDLWEFFLHRVRVFGQPVGPPKLPPRLDFREMHAQLRYWSQVVSDNPG
ncbi:glycoprotein-N-acetylgalactosamine 3-beta-galactosyltransferase 1-like [Drosophila ficusphila]|uniref:glycoprotein-N-acetylgalactosamine 3-beta-galactosyltransferase 1-like n=1 Tax=Drosophila ficusphila TaxID=30025 RepID=UPI0007E811DC|nr:glycoprotein-N-acetylgalactosamine 3-beta-galactosyltransferase 1-like [Drosophila ficusphila]